MSSAFQQKIKKEIKYKYARLNFMLTVYKITPKLSVHVISLCHGVQGGHPANEQHQEGPERDARIPGVGAVTATGANQLKNIVSADNIMAP